MSKKIKLILLGPGNNQIPPIGWGAIESLIWDYYENLKKSDTVDVFIVNDSNIHRAIYTCNKLNADIVHIMYDDHIIIVPHLKYKTIFYTSHYACITHPQFENHHADYINNVFKRVLLSCDRIIINSISPFISDIYRKYGFTGKINTVSNGAREDKFRYIENPDEKSIYVAKIEYRKCQYKYQEIPGLYFVGNYHNSPFDSTKPNYLGEWNKEQLYKSLTEYGNLVLLSVAEADPLVIKEALIAGLGVVISSCCIANLDLSKEFITVIPDDKLEDISYVSDKIKENLEYSKKNRSKIREYALEFFSWKVIINKYTQIIQSVINNPTILNESTIPNKIESSIILKRIALIGPGILPIPPTSWGAVEILLWDYYNELMKQGYEVTVINISDLHEIISIVNTGNYDFVHIHYDAFYKILPFLKCQRIAITSHYPYIDKVEHHIQDGYDNFFLYMTSQNQYYNFVLADKDVSTFIDYGANPTYIRKIKNGINSSLFRFTETDYNGRTIYLGKITDRKNQHLFQEIDVIDFIGSRDDSKFDTSRKNYLGEWSRERIYNELTNYSNLILLSGGEADPLVVKEALIAGLGIIINRSSAENLDISKEFITIIDDDKISDIDYIRLKIEENKRVANKMRKEIRDYGITSFDISIEVSKYIEICKSIM